MAATETIFREVVVTRMRGARLGREVRGWLVAPIVVGGRLIVREGDDQQMTSSPIRRLLVDDVDTRVVYVETQNSAYRVLFTLSDECVEDCMSVRIDLEDGTREVTLVEPFSPAPSSTRRPR